MGRLHVCVAAGREGSGCPLTRFAGRIYPQGEIHVCDLAQRQVVGGIGNLHALYPLLSLANIVVGSLVFQGTLEILDQFNGQNMDQVRNKSAYLAGVMKRYKRDSVVSVT